MTTLGLLRAALACDLTAGLLLAAAAILHRTGR